MSLVVSREKWFLSGVWAVDLVIKIEARFAHASEYILGWLAAETEGPKPRFFPWLGVGGHWDGKGWSFVVRVAAKWIGRQSVGDVIYKFIVSIASISPEGGRTLLAAEVVTTAWFISTLLV